jgi:anti-anti-sigma factor
LAEFTSTQTRPDGGCTITVNGEVDIATVEEFLDAAEECISGGSKAIVIDLGGVEFIDSSGLGALVRIRNRARQHGADVTLAHVPAPVHRVLEVSGLLDAFGTEA